MGNWILLVSAVLWINVVSSRENNDAKASVKQIEEFLRNRKEEYRKIFIEALNKSRARRNATEHGLFEEKQPMLDTIETKELDLFIDYYNILYAVSIDKLLIFGTDSKELLLYSEGKLKSVKISGISYRISYFRDHGKIRLIIGYKSNQSKQEYFIQVFSLENNEILPISSRMTFEYKIDFEVVKLKNDNYMLTWRSNSRETPADLYELTPPTFNHITKYTSESDLITSTMWLMEGSLYVIIAQRTDLHSNKISVLIYNENEKEFNLLQNIFVKMVTKALHFSNDDDHYLIFLVEETPTVYYWWEGDQFLEQEQLNVTSAVDIKIGLLSNGKTVIGVATKTSIVFFVQNRQEFRTAGILSLMSGQTVDRINFINFTSKDLILIIFVDKSFKIYELSMKQTARPYDEKYESSFAPLFQCLASLRETLYKRTESIDSMLYNASRVWTTTLPHIIDADVIIQKNLIIEKTAVFNDVFIEFDTSNLDYKLYESLKNNFLLKDFLINEVKNVVTKSTTQEITGSLDFKNPIVSEDVRITLLSSDTVINNVSIKVLSEYALKRSGFQKITGLFKINYLEVKDVYVHGKVNNIEIKDLFLINVDQTVTGYLNFGNIRVDGDIVVQGKINNIPFDTISTKKTRIISGRKTFEHLSLTGNIDVRTNTNKIKLSTLATKVININSDHLLTGYISFKEHVHVSNLKIKRVNGKIFEKLYQDAVFIQRDQTIRGLKTFRNVITINQMEILGTFNDRDLNLLLTTNTRQNVTGTVKFTHKITFKTDIGVETINSMKLNDKLAFGNQTIITRMHFKDNITVKHIEFDLNSTINKTKFMELVKIIRFIKNEFHLIKDQKSIIKSLADIKNIKIAKLWRKSKDQVICVNVNFTNTVTFNGGLTAGTLLNNLIKLRGDKVIHAETTFVENVDSSRINLTLATVNGIRLRQLLREIYLITDSRTIMGTKIFHSLTVENKIVTNMINGRLTSDIMLLNASQTVTGSLKFEKHSVVEKLSVNNLIVNTINQINVSNFLNEVIIQDSKIVIKNKIFDNVIVKGSVKVEGMIDGVSVTELMSRVVTTDTKQTVTGKTFKNNLHFKSDLSIEVLNELDFNEHIRNVVIKDSDKIIYGRKIIRENVIVNNQLHIDGLINNVNIELLQSHALSKTKPTNTFFNHFTFYTDLKIDDLHVDYLNGVQINKLVLTDKNETFSNISFFLIKNYLSINNIELRGLLNKKNITEFAEKALYRRKKIQTLTKAKHIKNLIVNGSITVKSKINDEDPSIFFGESAIVQFKNFRKIRTKNLHVKFINNVDLSFLSDLMLRSTEQTIHGKKIFINEIDLILERDLICDNLTATNINNLVMSEVVLKESNQTIRGNIGIKDLTVKNLQIIGRINGRLIPDDFILKNTNEVINGTTYLKGFVRMERNLTVNGLVDGVNISFFLKEFLHNIEQYFWNFLDDVTVNKLIIRETINGVKEKDLTTKTTIITDAQNFTNLFIGTLEVNFVNSYNFTHLLISSNEITNVTMEVRNKMSVNKLVIVHTINNYSIEQFVNRSIDYLRNLTNIETSLVSLKKEFNALKSQYHGISEFAHFSVVNELVFGSVVNIIAHPKDIFGWTLPDSTDLITVWINQTCKNYKTIFFESNGKFLSNIRGPYEGRFIPILGTKIANLTDGENALIMIKRRGGCLTKPVCRLKMFKMRNIADVIESNAFNKITPLPVLDIEDAKIFHVNGELYLVITSTDDKGHSVMIYGYEYNGWKLLKTLPTLTLTSIDLNTVILGLETNIYLAVANRKLVRECRNHSLIYKWDISEKQFIPVHPVMSSYANAVSWITRGEQNYLLVGHKNPNKSLRGYFIPMLLYVLEKQNFYVLQNIPIYDVISINPFSLGGEDYVLVTDTLNDAIHVLQWRGYNNLQEIQIINFYGVQNVAIFYSESRIFAAVSSTLGKTIILEAIIRGSTIELSINEEIPTNY